LTDSPWQSPDLSPPPEAVLSAAPEGCEPYRLFTVDPLFLNGDPESLAIRLRYFAPPDRSFIRANAWYGPDAQGPPGHAHGGSMASLLDEAMGGVAWAQGHRCLALEIKVQFRKALPLGTLVQVRSWVERVDEKKVYCRAEMRGLENELYSESSGLFLELDPEKIAQFGKKFHTNKESA